MKAIEIYETNDGSRFDKKEEAIKYEGLCDKCNSINLKLGILGRDLESNEYIQHDPEVIKNTFREFMGIVADSIPDYSNMAIECGNGERHMSHIYRVISDYNIKCLSNLMFRFYCIDFKNGKEFQQPYFTSHQEKVTVRVKLDNSENFSPTCATCNSYEDGKCTNFGKEVKAEDSCKYYQSDVIEYTCQQCGRKYEITDSDAGNRKKFCCKACENGY